MQDQVWRVGRNMQRSRSVGSVDRWSWWAWKKLRPAPWVLIILSIKNASGRTVCLIPAPPRSITPSLTYQTASKSEAESSESLELKTTCARDSEEFVYEIYSTSNAFVCGCQITSGFAISLCPSGGSFLGNQKSGSLSSTLEGPWTQRENWAATGVCSSEHRASWVSLSANQG